MKKNFRSRGREMKNALLRTPFTAVQGIPVTVGIQLVTAYTGFYLVIQVQPSLLLNGTERCKLSLHNMQAPYYGWAVIFASTAPNH